MAVNADYSKHNYLVVNFNLEFLTLVPNPNSLITRYPCGYPSFIRDGVLRCNMSAAPGMSASKTEIIDSGKSS